MTNQSYTPSTNGLQSYIDASPEYELAPIGIASMQDQAQKLAEFGRNGDIYVIHAAQGETVIPMEVLEANPQIKALLFNQMAEMVLDPQGYVVGDQLNSLNPVTGMPEFFFSSIFKGIKKAVKAVVKVVKKIAPIALPIIAATVGFPFLLPSTGIFAAGSMASMALSSGIGTLVSGGSLKDAFKSALIAGGSAGIAGAFKGAWNAPGGITGPNAWSEAGKGFLKTAYDPIPKVTSQIVRPETVLTEPTIATPELGLRPSDSRAALARQSISSMDTGPVTPRAPLSDANVVHPSSLLDVSRPVTIAGGGVQQPALDSFSEGIRPDSFSVMSAPSLRLSSDLLAPFPELDPTPPGFWDKTGDLLFRGGDTKAAIDATTSNAGTLAGQAKRADLIKMGVDPLSPKGQAAIIAASEKAAADAGPNMLVKYGPTAGLGFLAAQGLGAFDVAEQEEITEEDRPDIGGGPVLTLAERQALADEQELQQASLDPFRFTPGQDVLQPTIFSAAGGSINYPERDLLVEGPGTEKSDEIPAMLSDGEFVINSKAVRGADPSGRGNRYAGAQNLYNLMRNFEMRA